MSKEEFSDQGQENRNTRRGGQKHGSFGGKNSEQRDGEQLRQEGSHSNTGIGDEKNPMRENEKE